MKHQILEKVEIPEGISCTYENKKLTCTKGSDSISRDMNIPQIEIQLQGNEIVISCKKGNKNQYKIIKSQIAHIKNLFRGLGEKFVYELEAVNVHFPMTLKVEGNQLAINNFLGEKTPRHAKIFPNVEVQIKGQKVTISSNDREAAGKTMANIEKATKVRGRDRRIFQDGIHLVSKPGRGL
ncbi:MAG: 50S ribosomal protein L6 [Nanoarchaeota archaeon]|nr:50S ribosomal protein L6 [Nanoarchaeota archaeon]MBU1103755.1 50S ribosomal protein L6 [Nanoarchaeota archaeon]